MSKTTHSVYIGIMVLITIGVTLWLAFAGYDYYTTPIEERFYHPQYKWFRPAGPFGHGLGIIGTLMILFGVALYTSAKRYAFLEKQVRLKYILEFHIFLCVLGPVLIVFHTTFKFGGLVSIAFWSMVAVVLSGVVGRFIYIRIPRTVDGRELSVSEVIRIKDEMVATLRYEYKLDEDTLLVVKEASQYDPQKRAGFVAVRLQDRKLIAMLNRKLKDQNYPKNRRKVILKTVKQEISLSRRIKQLAGLQKLLKYWHVFHMPFAIIMLIIVVVHMGITLAFGYKWIF